MSDPQILANTGANDRYANYSPRSCAAWADDFDRAVAEHHDRIGLPVYRLLGWRDGIEDAGQDVFLAAWTNWSRFRGRSSVELWLKRIAARRTLLPT